MQDDMPHDAKCIPLHLHMRTLANATCKNVKNVTSMLIKEFCDGTCGVQGSLEVMFIFYNQSPSQSHTIMSNFTSYAYNFIL